MTEAAPSRVEQYLILADDMSATAQALAEAATEALSSQPVGLTYRDRVLIGVALKSDGSFAALIDDARAKDPA